MKASELIEHLKSYIDFTGGDCEMLVFDKAEGVFLWYREYFYGW